MKTARTYISTLLFIAVFAVCALALRAVSTEAAGGAPITGYAWSDGIGWLDLNCSNSNMCATNNFGLSVAADGTITGYAWSDNIGWVSANSSDLSGCPSGTCSARITSGALAGWLKAVSGGSAQSGGWDGWISLSGSSPSYGPIVGGSGTMSGYAWGDTNVGWLNFAYASTTYSADVCANISGNQPVVPTGYIASGGNCVNYCTPQAYCSGNDLYVNTIPLNTCVSSFSQTCSYQCLSGACVIPPAPAFTATTGFTGHIQVQPSIVRSGNTIRVYWNVDNVASCTVNGSNGDYWTGTSSGGAGKLSTAITQRTVYTLTCNALSGYTPASFSESTTVNILPIFQEL
jgi:hypothetical protein